MLTDAAESEEQDGGFSLPAPKTDHEAVARTGWHWYRQVDHWQRIESPEHSRRIWLALQLNEKNIIQSTYLLAIGYYYGEKYSDIPSIIWAEILIVERLKYKSLKAFTRK